MSSRRENTSTSTLSVPVETSAIRPRFIPFGSVMSATAVATPSPRGRRPTRLQDLVVPQSDVRLVSSQDLRVSRSQVRLAGGQQVQIFKGFFALEGSNTRRKGFLVVGDSPSRENSQSRRSLSGSQTSLVGATAQTPGAKERSQSAEGRGPTVPKRLGLHASLSHLPDSSQSDSTPFARQSRLSGFRDRLKSALASPQAGRRGIGTAPTGKFSSTSREGKTAEGGEWRPQVPKRTTSLSSLNAEMSDGEDLDCRQPLYAPVTKEFPSAPKIVPPDDEENLSSPPLPPRRYSSAGQAEKIPQLIAVLNENYEEVDGGDQSKLIPPPKPPRSILKKKSREDYDWEPPEALICSPSDDSIQLDLALVQSQTIPDSEVFEDHQEEFLSPSTQPQTQSVSVGSLKYDRPVDDNMQIPTNSNISAVGSQKFDSAADGESKLRGHNQFVGTLAYERPLDDSIATGTLLTDQPVADSSIARLPPLPVEIGSLSYDYPVEDMPIPQVRESPVERDLAVGSDDGSLHRCDSCEDLVESEKSSRRDSAETITTAISRQSTDQPNEIQHDDDLAELHSSPPGTLSHFEPFSLPQTPGVDESTTAEQPPLFSSDRILSEEELEEIPVTNIDELMSRMNLLSPNGNQTEIKTDSNMNEPQLPAEDFPYESDSMEGLLARADAALGVLRQLKTEADQSDDDEDIDAVKNLMRIQSDTDETDVEMASIGEIPPTRPILTLRYDQPMAETTLTAEEDDNWSQNNLCPSEDWSDGEGLDDSDSLLTEISSIKGSLMELNDLMLTEASDFAQPVASQSQAEPPGAHLVSLEKAIERHSRLLSGQPVEQIEEEEKVRGMVVTRPIPPVPLDLTFDHLLFNLLCQKETFGSTGDLVDSFCQTDTSKPPAAIFPSVNVDTQTGDVHADVIRRGSEAEETPPAKLLKLTPSGLVDHPTEPIGRATAMLVGSGADLPLLRLDCFEDGEELEDFDPVEWQFGHDDIKSFAPLSPITEEFAGESDGDDISFDVSRGENCQFDDVQSWSDTNSRLSAGEPQLDSRNPSDLDDSGEMEVSTIQTFSVAPPIVPRRSLVHPDSPQIIRQRNSQKLRPGMRPTKLRYVESFSSELSSEVESDMSREATLERNCQSEVALLANITAYRSPMRGFCPLVTKRTTARAQPAVTSESPVDFRVFYTLPRVASQTGDKPKVSSKLRRSTPVQKVNKTVIPVAQRDRNSRPTTINRSDTAESFDSANFNTFPRVARRQHPQPSSSAVVFEKPSESEGLVLTRDLPRAKLIQLKVDKTDLSGRNISPNENFFPQRPNGICRPPSNDLNNSTTKFHPDLLNRRVLKDYEGTNSVEITRL